MDRIELSLVVPARNEEDSLRPLYERVVEAFGPDLSWELVLVDDGSTDRTAALIGELAAEDPRVRGVILESHSGQTAATLEGMEATAGVLIGTVDADLQNDPADLPKMMEVLGDNDAVVGYRVKRHDNLIRRLASRFANALRNWITRDSIRDTGCSVKLYRAGIVSSIPRFEGMHRFIPTLLRYAGYQVIEMPVSHRSRERGTSKYGIFDRGWRGFFDLLAVRWMRSRLIRARVREQVGGPP